MTTVEDETWLAVTPRDTVAIRDGRSFNAGTDSVAVTSAPRPSSIAGVVGQAYQAEPAEVRGPVLGVPSRLGGWRLRFPAPRDLVVPDTGGLTRLRPEPLPPSISWDLGDQAPGEPSHLLRGAGTAPSGWIDGEVLAEYLDGTGSLAPGSWLAPGDELAVAADVPWATERRLGLARRDDRTAAPGLLYQAEHLRMHDNVTLLARVVGPPKPQPVRTVVQLGGERRLVDVSMTNGVALPAMPAEFPDGIVVVYLATPAFFPAGWRWAPDGADLVTAAIDGPEAVATASPREGLLRTRCLRWAVPAGSVYYLRFRGPDPALAARDWAVANHGRCLDGQVTDGRGLDRLRTAGFGMALVGRW